METAGLSGFPLIVYYYIVSDEKPPNKENWVVLISQARIKKIGMPEGSPILLQAGGREALCQAYSHPQLEVDQIRLSEAVRNRLGVEDGDLIKQRYLHQVGTISSFNVLPFQYTVQGKQGQFVWDNLLNYFSCCERPLMVGDELALNGIKYKVVSISPDHFGMATHSSILNMEGQPLQKEVQGQWPTKIQSQPESDGSSQQNSIRDQEKSDQIQLQAAPEIQLLKKHFDTIVGAIVLPVKHPQVIRHFGVKPPKGVLLSGKDQIKKMQMVQAVAKQNRANLFSIQGEILQQCRKREGCDFLIRLLRDVLASGVSTIIYISNIDSFAKKIPKNTIPDPLKAHCLSSLLDCMDRPFRLNASGGWVFVASTLNYRQLNPSIRRSGRLDRVIDLQEQALELN